jgi:hypothetical protein
MATVLVALLPHVGLLPVWAAGGPTTPPPVGPGGSGGVPVGPTVNPLGSETTPRGIVNPGLGTSDSNNRSIALSASIGGGTSVVYYFDTVANRLCVYQYVGGSKPGLRLLAARSIEWDLKLNSYRDLSEKNPREMQAEYEQQMQQERARKDGGVLPTKRVDLPMGGR